MADPVEHGRINGHKVFVGEMDGTPVVRVTSEVETLPELAAIYAELTRLAEQGWQFVFSATSPDAAETILAGGRAMLHSRGNGERDVLATILMHLLDHLADVALAADELAEEGR